ncbi:MAG: sodium:solute symporter [Myxococcales bacterium]|nr:sodium:solute symporter [Myxococcales bacterium]MCB9643898.1 sodium:solute symporter [Myxococcales bacterium]
MTSLDWIVLIATIAFIVIYGWWKTRGHQDINTYLRGGNELKWPTIGLSIMATQASAITFLSTPGQAYEDGMRFIQMYLGLPLAMIVIAAFIVPIYYKLNVFTAYEYLELRFDVKMRFLGAFLFLIQRGLAAGITIYAPSIILASVMGWSLQITNVVIGTIVILYTVSGGTKAVSQTQKQQMVVIMTGMFIAAFLILYRLPSNVSVSDATSLAGALGRMNVIDFGFGFKDRYNFWSGIIGGFFLAMSYFGTDQSQVQRYLSGRSITESRLGLLFNGMLKIPMQFIILYIGVLVFVFYLFHKPPIFFNTPALQALKKTQNAGKLADLQKRYDAAFLKQKAAASAFINARKAGDTQRIQQTKRSFQESAKHLEALRKSTRLLIYDNVPRAKKSKEADYIFIFFIINILPAGIIGLLIAVILSAAMSSTASELNALGTTTVIDFYRRTIRPKASDKHYVIASKVFTVFWGVVALAFASFASLVDNLIEAVNILGSIFYGTILGIFLVAFFLKRVGTNATFVAALIAQTTILTLFFTTQLGYLWYNLIGCAIVVVLSLLLRPLDRQAAA